MSTISSSLKRGSKTWIKTIMLAGVILVFFLPLIQTAEAQSDYIVAINERYEAMPFGPGAVVIPMDEKQNSVIESFGFMHALLRNETVCHRLIGPPDSTIKTDVFPLGANYSGGPIVLIDYNITVLDGVRAAFTNVTLHNVTETFISRKV